MHRRVHPIQTWALLLLWATTACASPPPSGPSPSPAVSIDASPIPLPTSLPSPTPEPALAPSVTNPDVHATNDAIIRQAQAWEQLGLRDYRVTVAVESAWLTLVVTTTVADGRIVNETCTSRASATVCDSLSANHYTIPDLFALTMGTSLLSIRTSPPSSSIPPRLVVPIGVSSVFDSTYHYPRYITYRPAERDGRWDITVQAFTAAP